MAIYTPSDPSDEFLLIDNSDRVFESSVGLTKNSKTGRAGDAARTPLHYFAPISPKAYNRS